MAETRTRPARERARREMLIMAETWFWRMQQKFDCGSWETMQEWATFGSSLKIRRFMTEVRSGQPTAVDIYASSSADIAQAREDGQMDLDGMSDHDNPRFPES